LLTVRLAIAQAQTTREKKLAELEALAGVDIEGMSRPTTVPANQPAGQGEPSSRPAEGTPTTRAAS
jgi:hypothetical protein